MNSEVRPPDNINDMIPDNSIKIDKNINPAPKGVKAGQKCMVFGRKSKEGKIRYYTISHHSNHYFTNTKTLAITAARAGLINGFMGAHKGLQNWSRFEIIEEETVDTDSN